jgi:hypothetical protein
MMLKLSNGDNFNISLHYVRAIHLTIAVGSVCKLTYAGTHSMTLFRKTPE